MKANHQTTLSQKISAACAATSPHTKERNAALSAIKWRLRSESGLYVCLGRTGATFLGNAAEAQVYDGRDNETLKAQFFKALTGANFTAELI